jgi:hypothetical protein
LEERPYILYDGIIGIETKGFIPLSVKNKFELIEE